MQLFLVSGFSLWEPVGPAHSPSCGQHHSLPPESPPITELALLVFLTGEVNNPLFLCVLSETFGNFFLFLFLPFRCFLGVCKPSSAPLTSFPQLWIRVSRNYLPASPSQTSRLCCAKTIIGF